MEIQVIKPRKTQVNRKMRVCAYARVSTDAEEQENSLENQISHYEEMIKGNPKYEFVDVYHDFGISGYKAMRPGFQQMITDARAGKIDLIITKSISRFARNTVTAIKAIRELDELGVGIFFELQNMNTLEKSGELMITIAAAFAQAESDNYSVMAMQRCKRKFEQGIPAVKIEKCYGYTLDDKGEVCIDKGQAKVIRLMYKLAHKKVWPSRIATYLNKQGYTTGTGKSWSTSEVFRILKKEYYKGDVLMQRTYLDADRNRKRNKGERDMFYIKNNHPAIVTRQEWDEVQEILQERSDYLKDHKQEKKMGGNSHNTYPLTGLLYCPHCGKMLHHKVNNRGKQEGWGCSTKIKKGADKCIGIYVPASVADAWEVTEPMTVIKTIDEYGQDHYSIIPKRRYEAKKSCPYEVVERTQRYSHSTYPLSGKLYCGKCGSLMHHQTGWKNRDFWWCGARVKKGPEACEGVRVPASVADAWDIDGEAIVWEGEDENGQRSYSYQSK